MFLYFVHFVTAHRRWHHMLPVSNLVVVLFDSLFLVLAFLVLIFQGHHVVDPGGTGFDSLLNAMPKCVADRREKATGHRIQHHQNPHPHHACRGENVAAARMCFK